MKLGITAVLLSALALAAWPVTVGAATHARAASAVSVKASEFKYVLSKKSVGKGSVTFSIKNTGHVNHDLKINGKKSKLLKPGKSTTLTVKFTKAGKYKFQCTVPGHAAAGMKGTLTVK